MGLSHVVGPAPVARIVVAYLMAVDRGQRNSQVIGTSNCIAAYNAAVDKEVFFGAFAKFGLSDSIVSIIASSTPNAHQIFSEVQKSNRWFEDHAKRGGVNLERAAGIEPASEAWKAPILPLNYARLRTAIGRV